jgi:hypothetical protein
MRASSRFLGWCGSSLVTLAALAAACSAGQGGSKFQQTGGSGAGTGSGATSPTTGSANGGGLIGVGSTGTGTTTTGIMPTCTANCTDFPSAPVFANGAPTNAASQFTGTATGTGPCILEPQQGSLFPHDWLRPRVNVTSSATLFQITFHTPIEANDYVVYTTQPTWTMPKAVWTALANNVIESDITVTVRASNGGGSFSESTTTFRVAPVDAGGSIVFWHTTSTEPGATTSALYGFSPGDEGVISALTPTQVQTPMYQASGQLQQPQNGTTTGQASCVGCHTSTPDGKAVSITGFWPWNVAIADVTQGMTGAVPSYVSQAGEMMAQTPWQGVTTFSAADWATGRYRYISSFAPRTIDPTQGWQFWPGSANYTGTGQDELIWVDLAGAGTVPSGSNTSSAAIGQALVMLKGTLWNVIPRTGDTRASVTPNWSHDGTRVAYTSTDSTSDGRVGATSNSQTPLTEADIYTVPFNGGNGGTVVQVAAETGVGEYYPDFSPDDKYLAYNRVANIAANIPNNSPPALYYRPDAEIWFKSSDGTGTATRLVANDPPACTGLTTATIHNSWPKWSPLVQTVNGVSYYFITFASARQSTSQITLQGSQTPEAASELFLAAIKVDASGNITSYPAIYLWNQDNLVTTDPTTMMSTVTTVTGLNLTPAWHDFVIPPVPPVMTQ